MSEWFNNTQFWEKLEPFLFHIIRTPQATKDEVAGVVNLLNLAQGDRVLDVGCGPGRALLPLARRGLKMTGLDIMEIYLNKIQKKCAAENLEVELVQEDMRTFQRAVGFEAAISLFSSFSYFSDPHDDLQTLKNIYDALAPGGRLLLDVNGRESLKRHFRERTDSKDESSGDYLVKEATINRRWEWIEHKWTLIQGDKQKIFTFGIRIYSGEELKTLLLKAGFSRVTLFGTFQGESYEANPERLIAVAEKF